MSQPPSPSVSPVNVAGKIAQKTAAQTQPLETIKAGSIVKAQVIQVKTPTIAERESIIAHQLALAKSQIGKNLTSNLKPSNQTTQAQNPVLTTPKNTTTANQLQSNTRANIITNQLNTLLSADKLSTLPLNIQSLVKSPSLVIAQIQYARQSNWVFTQEQLKPQDKVQVQIKQDGTLTLVNKPIHTQPNAKTAAIPKETLNGFNQGKNPVLTQNQQTLLLNVLKQSLPQQQSASHTFNTLNTLKTHIAATLNVSHPQPINQSINALAQALTQILNTPLTIRESIPAKALITAINQSGALLEPLLLKSTVSNSQQLQNLTIQPNTALTENIKSQLSQLAQILGLPLGQTNTAQVKAPASSPLQQLLQPFLNSKTPLNTLGVNPSSKETPSKQVALLLQLANTVQQGIARIRGDQAQQLLQMDSSANEANRLAPALFLELPIKHHDQYFSLLMHFFQRWKHNEDEPKKHNKQNTASGKHRQKVWEVYLEFELEKIGKIAAQVSSAESKGSLPKIRTTLWAKNTKARVFLSKHINQLEQKINLNGMQSAHIECSQGDPPENKKMYVSQSLIDIKT